MSCSLLWVCPAPQPEEHGLAMVTCQGRWVGNECEKPHPELRDPDFKERTYTESARHQQKVLAMSEPDTEEGKQAHSACSLQPVLNLLFTHSWRGKHSCVMTECAGKKLPRKSLCPGLALVSSCQPGLSKVGVLGESSYSLLPQTQNLAPFDCFKSCRELNIGAFRGRRGSFGGTLFALVSAPAPECSKNLEKSA